MPAPRLCLPCCHGGYVGGLAELMLIATGLSHTKRPDSGVDPFIHPASLSLARSLALVAHLSPPSNPPIQTGDAEESHAGSV